MLWKEGITTHRLTPLPKRGVGLWCQLYILLKRYFGFRRIERSISLRMVLLWALRKKDEKSLLSGLLVNEKNKAFIRTRLHQLAVRP